MVDFVFKGEKRPISRSNCTNRRGRLMMVIMVMANYWARIYPCCNSMLITLERPRSSSWFFFSLTFCLCCHNPPNSDMDYRIFIVRTDVNACYCTRGCTDTERESALKVDSGKKENPLPHRGIENLRQRRDGPSLYWAVCLWTRDRHPDGLV